MSIWDFGTKQHSTITEFGCPPSASVSDPLTSTLTSDSSILTITDASILPTTVAADSTSSSEPVFSILPIDETLIITDASILPAPADPTLIDATPEASSPPVITPRAAMRGKRQAIDSSTIDTGSATGSSTRTDVKAFTCSSRYGYEGMTRACKCTRLPAPTVTANLTVTTTTGAVTTIIAVCQSHLFVCVWQRSLLTCSRLPRGLTRTR